MFSNDSFVVNVQCRKVSASGELRRRSTASHPAPARPGSPRTARRSRGTCWGCRRNPASGMPAKQRRRVRAIWPNFYFAATFEQLSENSLTSSTSLLPKSIACGINFVKVDFGSHSLGHPAISPIAEMRAAGSSGSGSIPTLEPLEIGSTHDAFIFFV